MLFNETQCNKLSKMMSGKQSGYVPKRKWKVLDIITVKL